MNILYVPQLSMYDKQTKKLTPESDGNFNMMRNTIKEWHKYRPKDVFYILFPRELQEKEEEYYYHNIIPIFYDNYSISARLNRFNFAVNEISSLLRDIEINLIISDVIEITTNLKQLFNIELNQFPKIISNIRHVDEEVNYIYLYRVLDGIYNSDLVTILSESMRKKLKKQFIIIGIEWRFSYKLFEKIEVFEPSISSEEIQDFIFDHELIHSDETIITFPGRMSRGEEKRTNYDKFIEAINLLRKERQDFKVCFTDPNNAINPHYVEAQDWIYTIPKNRNIFLNLLNRTDIIVSLMAIEGFGGISIREALLFDCMPVIPYVDEYKKMAHEDYLGFVKEVTVDELVSALNWAIDNHKNIVPNYFKGYGKQFSIEEQFKKLYPKLEEVING